MKNFKKLLCSFLVVMVAMMFVISVPAKADEEDPEPVQSSLTVGAGWKNDSISSMGEIHYYAVSLSKAGWLTVDGQTSSLKGIKIEVLDYDMIHNFGNSSGYESSGMPGNAQVRVALDAGTYLVRATRTSSSYSGSYRVRASFVAANNTDSADHSDIATAATYALGTQIQGFFTQTNTKVDYYKFYVPSAQKLHMVVVGSADVGWMDVVIKDADLFRQYGKWNIRNEYNTDVELQPGWYALIISPEYSSSCGGYQFRMAPNVYVNSIKISGKKTMEQGKYTTLTAAVGPANAADKSVSWHSTNTSVLSVDSSGKVYASGCGVAYIYAQANDEKQMKSNYHKIVVKPAKISYLSVSHYRYSSYYKKRMYVYHYGVNGKPAGYQIQYSTNQKFKNGTKVKKYTGSGGHYIGSLKKGKLYFVRVRAYVKDGGKTYYGPWSATKRARIYH